MIKWHRDMFSDFGSCSNDDCDLKAEVHFEEYNGNGFKLCLPCSIALAEEEYNEYADTIKEWKSELKEKSRTEDTNPPRGEK